MKLKIHSTILTSHSLFHTRSSQESSWIRPTTILVFRWPDLTLAWPPQAKLLCFCLLQRQFTPQFHSVCLSLLSPALQRTKISWTQLKIVEIVFPRSVNPISPTLMHPPLFTSVLPRHFRYMDAFRFDDIPVSCICDSFELSAFVSAK